MIGSGTVIRADDNVDGPVEAGALHDESGEATCDDAAGYVARTKIKSRHLGKGYQ